MKDVLHSTSITYKHVYLTQTDDFSVIIYTLEFYRSSMLGTQAHSRRKHAPFHTIPAHLPLEFCRIEITLQFVSYCYHILVTKLCMHNQPLSTKRCFKRSQTGISSLRLRAANLLSLFEERNTTEAFLRWAIFENERSSSEGVPSIRTNKAVKLATLWRLKLIHHIPHNSGARHKGAN